MSTVIQKMFSSIADKYDLANDILSFGMHRLWRIQARGFIDTKTCGPILDICSGTGDLAFSFVPLLKEDSPICGLDFSREMLEQAKRKNKFPKQVYFLQGDATNLPFPDSSFDLVTIAFGIRNVTNYPSCLDEILRVLKPGGELLILEFGKPNIPGFASLYRWYSKNLMPLIGGVITGNRSAYEYLPRTSQEFPAGSDFVKILEGKKFLSIRLRSLFGGVAYLYCGKRAFLPSNVV